MILDQITIPVKEDLAAVENILTGEVHSAVESISAISKYVIENGGKRIRPLILLLSAKVAGALGENPLKLAAAVELLHTATLMHDDVVDDAILRRGVSAARAKWGNQISVLVGDFLLARATSMINSCNKPCISQNIAQTLAKAMSDTIEGELLEIDNQNSLTVDEDLYMKIIGGKTAALFGASARVAAQLEGLDKNLEDSLASFGRDIGLAFQIVDDILDYTSNTAQSGKMPGTDLKEGKLTYPLITILHKVDEIERATIRNALVTGSLSIERFMEVFSIIEKYDGIVSAQTKANEISNRAKEHLSQFKPSIERNALYMLADYAVLRRE